MPSIKIETPTLSHLTCEDFTHVYEPAEDSFLLLDALEDDIPLLHQRQPTLCLEVGSGSGVVSTALARTFGSSAFCIAIDISKSACIATSRTANENGTIVDVVSGDLIQPLRRMGTIDLLVFNPPYVPTPSAEVHSSLEEPLARAWAGGENGREVMDQLFPLVKDILAPLGLFYLVVVEDNNVPQICEKMSSLGFQSCVVKERRVRAEHLAVLRFERDSASLEQSSKV